jgi:hypothetical protein
MNFHYDQIRRTLMRLTSLAALAIAAIVSGSAVASAQVASHGSWVRVVHASSDAPAVDILANSNVVFQGLKFTNFTEYTAVPPGTYTFRVNLSGTDTTVLSIGPVALREGGAYTVYAVGKVSAKTLAVLSTEDDLNSPPPGYTRIRVVHAASAAPTVDVYATTPFAPLTAPTLASVPFRAASPYLNVPGGAYQARVTVAGGKTAAIDSGRLVLTGGSTRTLVAVDPTVDGGSFQLLALPDQN